MNVKLEGRYNCSFSKNGMTMTAEKTVNRRKSHSNKPTIETPDALHQMPAARDVPAHTLGGKLSLGPTIATGGMGIVQEGYDKNLKRRVAIKRPHPDLPFEVLDFCCSRLVEEAKITAHLDHPNVVPVHELNTDDDDEPYFTMKLVQGRELGEILRERSAREQTRHDLFRYLQIFLKVCDTVRFAHSIGVIHRDLKPSNVMIGDFGVVYLMDWGIARKAEMRSREDEYTGRRSSMWISQGSAGTPLYMAPEQMLMDRGEIDERTDVFLLGGILYEILTHQPTHRESKIESSMKDGMFPSIAHPQLRTDAALPSRLCDIAMKALKEDKSDRYQCVLDMQREVEEFIQSGAYYERRVFASGDIVCEENEVGDEAFIVVSGSCRVFKTIDGKKTLLRILGTSEVFGELAMLTGGRRTASVEAIDDLCLLVIKQSDFTNALGMQPLLATFMQTLAKRFVENEARLSSLERENKRLRTQREDKLK